MDAFLARHRRWRKSEKFLYKGPERIGHRRALIFLAIVVLLVGLGIFTKELWLSAVDVVISQAWASLLKVPTWYHNNREDLVPIATFTGAAVVAWAALRQAKTARLRHEEQTDADWRQRITESFSRAVEQLGNDKMEVRLGGIYTMARIARESSEEYWTVMDTLTAFVRMSARWNEPNDTQPLPEDKCISEEPPKLLTHDLATDVIAILSLIRRRGKINEDRERRMGWRFDLSYTDLRGAVLTSIQLDRVNLTGANLEGADFSHAHLQLANLSGAHLEHANLVLAHFEGANLSAAHFHATDLSSAHLEDANLTGAHLQGAFLFDAHLQGANLSSAHLEGAHPSDANLEDADLSSAHLEGTNLAGINFQNANLSGAHLHCANLSGANLQDANLTGAHLQGANLSGADLQRANLCRAHLEGACLSGANLQDANVLNAQFKGADLTGTNLEDASLTGAVRPR